VADLNAAVSAIGGLGAGSVLAQYLSAGKDRRSSRATALEALGQVEDSRWVPRPKGAPSFALAARSLQTAALLAHVPRRLLTEYLVLSQAAYWMSNKAFNEGRYPEDEGGAINAELSRAVREAAQGLADILWAPRITRQIIQRRALKRVARRVQEVGDDDDKSAIARSRERGT
jgi:hypothetical protein